MSKKTIRTGAKTVALILAIVLVVGGVIGGTIAWLMTETDPVVNTFTYGDINIELEETETDDGDNDKNTNEYEMIPGREVTKDPKVTVKAGSENCWLFVKLEKQGGDIEIDGTTYDFDDFLTYELAEGWTQLTDDAGAAVEGVYYREVKDLKEATDDAVFQVIKDDKVTVSEDVTKEMLNALDADDANTKFPTLTVTAYAVQQENIDSAQIAWAEIQEADETQTVTPAP